MSNQTSNQIDQVQSKAPTPVDAATVVVLRQSTSGMEVLMLKKNSKIYFGGMWVFPGGRVDPEDAHTDDASAYRRFERAAIREAREEAAIELSGGTLKHLSHWLPPAIRPKRFSTHFFLTEAPSTLAEVKVDGGEITEHAWVTPAQALKARHAGEVELVTPTFVTLDWLRRMGDVNSAMRAVGDTYTRYHTHILATDDGNIAFYEGDVAYESMDPHAPGPRRRANMLNTGWWWEEHDGGGRGPSPAPLDF